MILYSAIEVLRYSDYFEYPLRTEEILDYLNCKATIEDLVDVLEDNIGEVNQLNFKNGYWFLNGNNQYIQTRIRRNKVSMDIWNKLSGVIQLVSDVPFVEMIAITGSLAVNNSEKNSDIDLLVVTQPNRVWISRLILYFIEKLILKKYNINLCFNYIISSDNMKQQVNSLFIAREIIQMEPVYGLSVYNQFINENLWIREYFPNKDLNQHLSEKIVSQNILRSTDRIISKKIRKREGWLSKVLDKLNKIEYQRAVNNILRNYSLGNETNFTLKEYKGHFDGHQNLLFQTLQKNYLDS